MTKKITPLATRMEFAEKVLKGDLTNDEVARKLGVPSSSISGWCATYCKGRVAHPKKKGYFGLLNGNAVKTLGPKLGSKVAPTSVSIKRGKEWSITMGEWKLTLAGISEPEAILLEKI